MLGVFIRQINFNCTLIIRAEKNSLHIIKGWVWGYGYMVPQLYVDSQMVQDFSATNGHSEDLINVRIRINFADGVLPLDLWRNLNNHMIVWES